MKRHSISSFMWELLDDNLPNELKLKLEVCYGRECNDGEIMDENSPFIGYFNFKDFKVSIKRD